MNRFLLLFFILASCSGEHCIEADDFGHAKFDISSRYPSDTFDNQIGSGQVGPWLDSEHRVNGRPLAIMVRGWEYGVDANDPSELSAWCPWYGTNENSRTLSSFCERLQECQFADDKMCSDSVSARIVNAPCLLKNGVGLYALITEDGFDPNQSIASQTSPRGLSFHLGDSDSFMWEFDREGKMRNVGGKRFNYSAEEKTSFANSKLYFKILDRFYNDNNGQYRIAIKSGIYRTNPDPISYVTKLVKEFLFGTENDYGLIRNIYLGIVQNPGYRIAVSALLSLYIMFTGFSYLIGNINITKNELIIRIGKVAIISALLSSEYSWSFFNDYLFSYFIGGVQQILDIIEDAGATGPGAPGIISMMMAPQTLSKLFSLLFIDWLGFIYIILFVIALYFVLMVFFHAAVIYLSAFIFIGMIIVMGPIFLCFLLFGVTRSLFENWLRQLISYSVQPIILFTGLIFISMILRQEIYNSLGFRVCKRDFPNMSSSGDSIFTDNTKKRSGYTPSTSLFYWWFPQPVKGENFSRDLVKVPIPIDHFVVDGDDESGEISDSGFCEAYGCNGKRYIDLPFLSPTKDARRIRQFHNGDFVQLDGLLLIFIAIYLLHKFNSLSISVARFITSTSGNFTNLGNIAGGVMNQTFYRARRYLSGASQKVGLAGVDSVLGFGDRGAGSERRRTIANLMVAARQMPSMLIDKARISSLKKDALYSTDSIIAENVKKKTGLDVNKINKNAIKDYRAHIENIVKDFDSKNAKKISKELSKKDYSDMNNALSQKKYGTLYEKLNDKQKTDIDKILDNKDLRRLARDSSFAKRFQNAYVDAYISMSDKDMGLFGKKIKILGKIQEAQYQARINEARSAEESKQIGKRFISQYQKFKDNVFETVTGKKPIDPWNDVNMNSDSGRKTTYNESIYEHTKSIEREKLNENLDRLSNRYKENVTSPEFLVSNKNNPEFSQFKNLADKDIKNKVYQALIEGEKPVIMGDTYMKEHAKDSEMKDMIDRAYHIKKEIFKNDEFISRQFEYQITSDITKEEIQSKYNLLKDHFAREIKPGEMPELLKEYYIKQGKDIDFTSSEVKKLEKSMKEFSEVQDILLQLDDRKIQVTQEIDNHVNKINNFRNDAGMEKYTKQQSNIEQRSIKTIDDLLGHKK